VKPFVKKAKYIAILVVVILSLAFIPLLYNHYVFPLGRLHKSIEIGDKYEEILGKFERYYSMYRNRGREVDFNSGIRDTDFYMIPTTPSKYLYLYHDNLFDDVQLGVLFDGRQRVRQIFFISD